MRDGSKGFGIATYLWIAILGLVLGVLAALQYRWIGQVAEAERERLTQDVNVSSIRVLEDLRRELASLFRAATVASSGAVDWQERYQSLWAEWGLREPQLVSRVFHLAVERNNDTFQLQQFDPVSGRLENVVWPDELQAVRRRIERMGLVNRDSGTGSGIGPTTPDEPEPASPFMMIPLRPQNFQPGPPLAFAIAELNSDYLVTVILPEFVLRHFPTDGAYRAAVIHRSTTLFEAAAGDGAMIAQAPDIRRSIFRDELAGPFAPAGAGRRGPRPGMFRRFEPPAGAASDPMPNAPGPRRGERFPGPFARPDGPGFPSLPLLAPDWQLVVKHSAGSVDQAVVSLRYRNLGISFAILLVLAAAIVVTTISQHRARSLSHLRMDFVARVSHELKTPVTVIRSAAFNLFKGIVESPEDVRRYGRMIDDEGRRLGEMVDQIMLFSKMESGAAKYNLQIVDIREVVSKAVTSLSGAIEKQGCSVDMDLPSDLPEALADPTALTHCVQNLVNNAVKYGRTPESCVIRVSAQFDRPSQQMQIVVADAGTGIDPSDLPHVFEPFYRGQSVSAETPGNGLGLSLVKKMMEGQGGRVTVQSARGQGSRFTLHIPVRETSKPT